MRFFEITGEWRGKPITAAVRVLDQGIEVELFGGDLTHIGAVSVASYGKQPETIAFPGHKESLLSEGWAANISLLAQVPVAVTAGIHYDNVTRDEIAGIVEITEQMRAEVMKRYCSLSTVHLLHST